MVYYTALPLIMQTEPNTTTNICTNANSEDESVRISNLSNNTIYPENQLYNNLHMTNHKLSDTVSVPQTVQIVQQQQKPQFKCDQCNMLFGSKSAHTSHIKSHAKLVQQQLGRVSTSVSVNDVSAPHMSSSDPYQCDMCKKTFSVPARLVRHYRTHTGERPFECEFCHKMFSVKENLQVHRRIHTKERPYKCGVCERAFEHSGKLHRHMRIHTGERPHKCSVCEKTFIQSGQLVIHMRTHTGEKPYKCPVEGCGKGFTCSKQLKVHSRTHTGEKPYHCDICFRDFGYNHVLKLHRVQHYGSKCYKCTICDETFKSKKEMEAHIKGHANEIPDEDGGDSNISSFAGEMDTIKLEPTNEAARVAKQDIKTSNNILPETPRESSSEANSDGDELAYYNMYSRFEQSVANNYGVQSSGVNPALLAAVSMATSSVAEMDDLRNPISSQSMNLSVTAPLRSPQNRHENTLMQNSFVYEPLAVMRQQGYFAPVPKVEDYKSSIDAANEIVKRVEAALAGTEPLLTPPRSSPESPDRASSPESDSILMADRDIMSLPLRKRKLYLKENQNEDSPVMRMSSVIQFARAS